MKESDSMQVPEKLALIGGSILLSSTLIFTLKSQASSIIPHVGHSIGNVYQDITDTNAKHGVLSFDDAFRNAQRQGWQTGHWGTSKYYIDNNENMHVGAGSLQSSLYNTIGGQAAEQIKSINIEGNVYAPQDSSFLLSTSSAGLLPDSNLKTIKGTGNINTSHVTNMNDIFSNDTKLQNLDLSHWDTSQVTDIEYAFWHDTSLINVNLSSWNTRRVSNKHAAFDSNDVLSNLILGNDTYLQSATGYFPNSNWKNGNQLINNNQLFDSGVHPGTWTKQ